MSDQGTQALRRRRRVRWTVTGTAVLVAAVVGTVIVLTRVTSAAPTAAPEGPKPVRTATVTRTDLADRRTLTGKLTYGGETKLTGRKPGTITGLPAAGATIDRGATVYSVDARPVPLFLGAIPLYRELRSGMANGPDVKVVEENLKALGFGGFGTPDEKFTDATAAAVKKWQKSLELDQTGVLGTGDVVVTPAAIRVSSLTAAPGDQGTGPLLEYTGVDRVVTVQVKADQRDTVKTGAEVTLTTAGGRQLGGRVTDVVAAQPDGSGQDGTQPKFDVTVTPAGAVDAADGTPVDVRVVADSRKGVLVVPVGALLALAEGGYAVEVADGAARRLVAVRTGLFADDRVEVSGPDLAEGLRVVTTS